MEKISIGVVLKPQGLKGEIKIRVYSDELSHFLKITKVYIARHEYTVTNSAIRQGYLFLRLQGLEKVEDVEGFRNKEVFIDRAEAMKKNEGEEYIVDLIGCKIVDENGLDYGKIKNIENYGATDIIFVSGTRPFSFPCLSGVFTRVDTKSKVVYVDSTKLCEVIVYEN